MSGLSTAMANNTGLRHSGLTRLGVGVTCRVGVGLRVWGIGGLKLTSITSRLGLRSLILVALATLVAPVGLVLETDVVSSAVAACCDKGLHQIGCLLGRLRVSLHHPHLELRVEHQQELFQNDGVSNLLL